MHVSKDSMGWMKNFWVGTKQGLKPQPGHPPLPRRSRRRDTRRQSATNQPPRVEEAVVRRKPAPPRAERACLALSQSRTVPVSSVGGDPPRFIYHLSSPHSPSAVPGPPVRPTLSSLLLASAVGLAGRNQWRSTRGRWWRASSPSPCSSCSATWSSTTISPPPSPRFISPPSPLSLSVPGSGLEAACWFLISVACSKSVCSEDQSSVSTNPCCIVWATGSDEAQLIPLLICVSPGRSPQSVVCD